MLYDTIYRFTWKLNICVIGKEASAHQHRIEHAAVTKVACMLLAVLDLGFYSLRNIINDKITDSLVHLNPAITEYFHTQPKVGVKIQFKNIWCY